MTEDQATAKATVIKAYLPDTFINDVRECSEELEEFWEQVSSLPVSRRGRGTGRWVEMDEATAKRVREDAKYREEYWLTDAYGVEEIQPHERTAGRAAQRVRKALDEALP